jgi:hypothetical protein
LHREFLLSTLTDRISFFDSAPLDLYMFVGFRDQLFIIIPSLDMDLVGGDQLLTTAPRAAVKRHVPDRGHLDRGQLQVRVPTIGSIGPTSSRFRWACSPTARATTDSATLC